MNQKFHQINLEIFCIFLVVTKAGGDRCKMPFDQNREAGAVPLKNYIFLMFLTETRSCVVWEHSGSRVTSDSQVLDPQS